ncbi:hypothetical protein [uncultured Winogradskyella sp.]|uniref:hypothetical protein n=1 Tax=uncultured Winogradskyella sp. TaxID=395353 RepID=UPI0030EE3C93|tara:strand:- start:8812 stop:9501 length:690 start_codon:yes stop_codon:yes gene_type:complete
MKLTASQIQELYAFTRQHFVEHYDLQTELVDHLANDIETQWQEQPKLSFEDAKNTAFKKFGIFGFMDAIEQKGKAMNKRYRGYLWNELKKWFEIPQAFATLGLFLLFYFSFTSSLAVELAIAYYVLVIIWSVTKSILLNRQFKRRKKASNKKWLLEEMIFKQAGGTSLVFLSQIYNIHLMTGDFLSNPYVIIVLSVAFTAIALIYYISFELIPNKAEKLLNETYPEFSL